MYLVEKIYGDIPNSMNRCMKFWFDMLDKVYILIFSVRLTTICNNSSKLYGKRKNDSKDARNVKKYLRRWFKK